VGGVTINPTIINTVQLFLVSSQYNSSLKLKVNRNVDTFLFTLGHFTLLVVQNVVSLTKIHFADDGNFTVHKQE
jgi:hypothetical protein